MYGRLCQGRITGDEYDKKASELKALQVELAMRIEQHQKGEDGFRTTVCTENSIRLTHG